MTRYLIALGVFIIIAGFLAIGLKLDPRLVLREQEKPKS